LQQHNNIIMIISLSSLFVCENIFVCCFHFHFLKSWKHFFIIILCRNAFLTPPFKSYILFPSPLILNEDTLYERQYKWSVFKNQGQDWCEQSENEKWKHFNYFKRSVNYITIIYSMLHCYMKKNRKVYYLYNINIYYIWMYCKYTL